MKCFIIDYLPVISCWSRPLWLSFVVLLTDHVSLCVTLVILQIFSHRLRGMQHQIMGVDPGSCAVWRFLKYDGDLLLGFGGIDKFHITWDTLLIHLFRSITEVQRYICFVYEIYPCSLSVEFICFHCPWNLFVFLVRGITGQVLEHRVQQDMLCLVVCISYFLVLGHLSHSISLLLLICVRHALGIEHF